MEAPNTTLSASPLEQLPVELLVKVLSFSPDLGALHSLLLASAHVSRVFLQSARQITDAVLSASLPPATQTAARTVVRIRVSAHTCRDLDDVISLAQDVPPRPPPQMPSAAEPALLRRFVALAHDVHCLAHMCLDHHLVQCLSLRPSRPPEGEFTSVPAPEEGYPYEVPAQEPPSWIEEHRVLRELWEIQVWRETRLACLKGRLALSNNEISYLALGPEVFYDLGMSFRREQMVTVVKFLGRLGGDSGEELKPWHQLYSFEGSFRHRRASKPQFALEKDRMRHWRVSLNNWPPAWSVFTRMAKYEGGSSFPIHFGPYRKYGFAFWDIERMVNLGFYTKDRTRWMSNPYGLYFTWLSILTDEERNKYWRNMVN